MRVFSFDQLIWRSLFLSAVGKLVIARVSRQLTDVDSANVPIENLYEKHGYSREWACSADVPFESSRLELDNQEVAPAPSHRLKDFPELLEDLTKQSWWREHLHPLSVSANLPEHRPAPQVFSVANATHNEPTVLCRCRTKNDHSPRGKIRRPDLGRVQSLLRTEVQSLFKIYLLSGFKAAQETMRSSQKVLDPEASPTEMDTGTSSELEKIVKYSL